MNKFFAVVLVSLIGCYGYSVRENKDKYTGTSTYAMENNFVSFLGSEEWARDAGLAMDKIEINAVRMDKEQQVQYSLMVRYESDEWMFISSGQSLQFLIDEKPVLLTTVRGSVDSRNIVNNKVFETAFFMTDKHMIRRIGGANTVMARVVGKKRVIETKFSEENIKRFKEFSSNY